MLVSGLTVMIAMAGMFLAGNATFMSFAIGTILVVAVAVLGSLTVLPAVLSKLGDRVEKGRVPFVARLRARRDGESRVWAAILDRVLRRPLVSAVARRRRCSSRSRSRRCGMHTVDPGVDGTPARPADHADLRPHPGRVPRRSRSRPIVVVKADDVTDARGRRGDRASCATQALATGQLHEPVDVDVSPDKTVAVIVDPDRRATAPTPRPTRALDDAARRRRSRRRSARSPASSADVTGMTAGSKDFNDTMKRARCRSCSRSCSAWRSCCCWSRSARSSIPIKAIVLNLLSVGAAYGVLVLVFQDGHGETLLGFQSIGGIALLAAAVPVRDPVRPVDGLPRVHPQPDPRGGRPRA